MTENICLGEPMSGRPLHTVGASKTKVLMYNLGVSLLHGGKPLQAFDCLTEAVQVYHMNPRLWLRLAECCIMVHKPVSINLKIHGNHPSVFAYFLSLCCLTHISSSLIDKCTCQPHMLLLTTKCFRYLERL